MACVAPVYRPRDAAHTVLHEVVAEHLEAFLGAVAEAGDGAGLPQFVEREFREFLDVRRVRGTAWRAFGARAARASTWCRFRVKDAPGVRAAGAGG